MSDSIRWKRSSLEGSWPQYERTRLGESLVCRLSRQRQRRVATFPRDNRWKHLSGKPTLRLGLVSCRARRIQGLKIKGINDKSKDYSLILLVLILVFFALCATKTPRRRLGNSGRRWKPCKGLSLPDSDWLISNFYSLRIRFLSFERARIRKVFLFRFQGANLNLRQIRRPAALWVVYEQYWKDPK